MYHTFWNLRKAHTEGVVSFVTVITAHHAIVLVGTGAQLAALAVQTLPLVPTQQGEGLRVQVVT